MNTIKILKNIIVVAYYWLLLNFILETKSVIEIALYNKTIGGISDVKIIGEYFDLTKVSNQNIILTGIIALSLFAIILRAIYLLKDSMNDLLEGNYFSEKVNKNFKSIGILFIISGIYEIIGLLIINILLESELSLSFDYSVILFIIIGLFFMFLSEVFNKARKIQDENELTI